jgi:serine protease AprX
MRARHTTAALLLLFLILLLCATSAQAGGAARATVDPSVLSELEAVGANGSVPVIVYAPGHVDDVTAALGKNDTWASLDLVDGVAVEVTAAELEQIAALRGVESVAADVPLFETGYADTMDVTNLTIGLGLLRPPEAGGPTGDGVTVAVLDSGSAEHVDLTDADGGSRVVAFVDFLKGKKHPYDDGGHGTFVDGLITGDGDASLPLDQGGFATQQFRGVAPRADIVSLKVLDKYGNGRASTLIRAIAWAIAHREQYDIRVMNISVEGPVNVPADRDPLALAVEKAWKAGIVVVCAAGNEGDFGPGGILSPGNDPYVITVGALDTRQTSARADDAVTHYSSIGPTLYDEYAKPDLVAPGNKVVSLRATASYIDRTYPQNRVPLPAYWPAAPAWASEDYFTMSGTSAAAPVVAGAVALMIEQDPSLTPDDVKLRLMATADALPGTTAGVQGTGVLDVPGALAATARADGPTLSADLGDGHTVLPPDVETHWQKYAWSKYAWSKYAWSKYAWSKYAWSKYAWSKYAWSKYAWSVRIDGQ